MEQNPQEYKPKHGKPYSAQQDIHKVIMDAIWANSGMFDEPYQPRHAAPPGKAETPSD